MPLPQQMTTEELTAFLINDTNIVAIDPEDWARQALEVVEQETDGTLEVTHDGEPVDLAKVIEAIKPSEEEIDEENAEREEAEDLDDEDGIETQKALVDVICKRMKKDLADDMRVRRSKTVNASSFNPHKSFHARAGSADTTRKDITPMPQQYLTKMQKKNAERREIITGGTPRNDDKARFGFKSVGEFACAVVDACAPGAAEYDGRLAKDFDGAHTKAPSTFGTGSVGADGGFAIPPQFVDEIMMGVEAEDSILSMCDQIPLTGRTLEVPYDDVEPWNNTEGIRAFWDGEEGSQHTGSKPKLQSHNYKLNGITALVLATEDLYEDAGALASWLPGKASEKLTFQVGEGIFRGTGAGQPVGFLNSNALVTVAKEAGQTSDTVNSSNVVNMWSRMYSRYRRDAVWFVSPSAESQLHLLTVDVGTGGQVIYMPAGGLSATPFATLMGRPVVPTEHCNTLGDVGDIVLGSMAQYRVANKASGLQVAESMHLYFDYSMKAFRFRMRVDGAPKLPGPIQPRTGSHTLSSFVTLAARA